MTEPDPTRPTRPTGAPADTGSVDPPAAGAETGGGPPDGSVVPDTPPASRRADRSLEQQRARHEPTTDASPELADDGMAGLVNNTGLDGEAASG